MNGKEIFKLASEYQPTGDQPEAIRRLAEALDGGRERYLTLEGVTGSGKTFTISNIIRHYGRPTLVISHNKTLAAQLYAELKSFFPENAVEYFVSYYDYYQPEAYIPQTDTFIEKDASINDEIERLRLAATDSLVNRSDVIIVASVSCIYGLGSPQDYKQMMVTLEQGQTLERDRLLEQLVNIQYLRNDYEKAPGTFCVRGEVVDIYPSYNRKMIRITYFGDEVESIRRLDPVSGHVEAELPTISISPAKHFVMPQTKIDAALCSIREELEEQVKWFEQNNKLLEAQRIRMRTEYDLEMMKEMGFCSGIENYSRHLAGRSAGQRPETLMDYIPGNFLTVIDESHVTIPQLRAMYNGDQARKKTLVEHGFRLPSALDNRPMNFPEFLDATHNILFTSATPGPFEFEHSGVIAQQVIRPTGIVDPPVEVRPLKNQIDDLMEEVRACAERNERVLVTTLTKRTAEDLSSYLEESGLRVSYLHSEIGAIERVEILRKLRKAEFDCLVGINLLREGLDLPEVSLVAVLDADKEGFLRSETSLIQTAGRAARHLSGRVILYADHVTDSMRRMMEKTGARRERQLAFNEEHGITPQAIVKSIQEGLFLQKEAEEVQSLAVRESGVDVDVSELINELEREMLEAAEKLEFERAAMLRDQWKELKAAAAGEPKPRKKSTSFRYPKSGKKEKTKR
ncbi:MAG: excinuclease ABC subunit UvrB [Kiritimatiellae bacterium]|nr:excinuclease ABC subunit UvrB [Kiritimatiellia bacterium]